MTAQARNLRRGGVLPGFGLSLGVTLGYLTTLILIPLAALAIKASSLGGQQLLDLLGERTRAAYGFSVGAALVAATLDALFGVLVAWVLVRYRFPLRGLLDALVDLPFALPTAVAGLALSALYAPGGWVGRHFTHKIAFARPGVVLALTFVGLPFVVRTVEAVLHDADPAVEEAAATLGASRWRTFRAVILPAITPALLTGFGLAFARALGEYGSIVFVSGNLPLQTEIAPVLIVAKLEQYDYAGATALALLLLATSFLLLLGLNVLQLRLGRRGRAEARR